MHTKTLGDGTLLDIDKLQQLIASTAFPMYIGNLKGLSRSFQSGFSWARYEACDTTIPGIVDKHNNLLDGRHRAYKIRDNGRATMLVKLATDQEIQLCIIPEPGANCDCEMNDLDCEECYTNWL